MKEFSELISKKKVKLIKQKISNHFVVFSDLFGNRILYREKTILEKCDSNDINTKIAIYEDRVFDWFLNVAERLKKDNEAGFVILQIATAYLEGNEQFRKGKTSKKNSEKFFKDALKRIFSQENIPDVAWGDFYENVRCGLFHDAMTRKNVAISGDFDKVIAYKQKILWINTHKFLDAIRNDFTQYIKELKDPKQVSMRINFEKIYDLNNSSAKPLSTHKKADWTLNFPDKL